MRISDWSSDVCSSDLLGSRLETRYRHARVGKTADTIAPRRFFERSNADDPVSTLAAQQGNQPRPAEALGDLHRGRNNRSEERRVGYACVSTGRSRWSPYH